MSDPQPGSPVLRSVFKVVYSPCDEISVHFSFPEQRWLNCVESAGKVTEHDSHSASRVFKASLVVLIGWKVEAAGMKLSVSSLSSWSVLSSLELLPSRPQITVKCYSVTFKRALGDRRNMKCPMLNISVLTSKPLQPSSCFLLFFLYKRSKQPHIWPLYIPSACFYLLNRPFVLLAVPSSVSGVCSHASVWQVSLWSAAEAGLVWARLVAVVRMKKGGSRNRSWST